MTPHKCPVCDGLGWATIAPQNGGTNIGEREPCHACSGKGVIWAPDSGDTRVFFGLQGTNQLVPVGLSK
jgi:DnaJ-class molecular chaperone